MKQTIKIKVLVEECTPTIYEKGDWIDLRAAEDVAIDGPYATTKKKKESEMTRKVFFPSYYIPLGVAMELPVGMEAIAVPRSSSIKKFGIIQANSMGIIDHSYKGDKDQWYMPILAVRDVDIKKGDRICQFRIQPSQKATFWQKMKWLMSSGVKIKLVGSLGNPERGGLGHSGRK